MNRIALTLIVALAGGAACSDSTPSTPDSAAPTDATRSDDHGRDSATADSINSDLGPADLSSGDGLRGDLSPDQGPDLQPNSFGTPYAAHLTYGGQVVMEGTISGATAWLALDTGAMPTAVDDQYGSGLFVTVDLQFGPVNRPQQGVASTDLSLASAFVGLPLGALVGSDILGQWYLGLDYHTPAVYLSQTPWSGLPPGGTAPPLAAPFSSVFGIPVVQGAVGQGSLEVAQTFIADTGSGVTLITLSVFNQIDPQGSLPRLEGYRWYTSSGFTPGFVTRLPSLKIGEAEVKGSWAVVVPDNHHMAGTLGLVGLPPNFLGFPFYREFLTGFAGPESRYLFYPRAPAAFDNEWRRVGVELASRAEGFRVEWVYEPSDALAQGIQIGDILLSVNGVSTSALSLAQVIALISGAPGTALTLQLHRGGNTITNDVLIEDLLPSI